MKKVLAFIVLVISNPGVCCTVESVALRLEEQPELTRGICKGGTSPDAVFVTSKMKGKLDHVDVFLFAARCSNDELRIGHVSLIRSDCAVMTSASDPTTEISTR